ncbi:unnamed protein product [Brassicogethes aeneus]|uniref:Carbonic anhydrase n=1 Tax=Brassicogethes aeneus TaxID=1431903 RepID=A0A9P0BBD7_BRAAE|nr:unnamed protein product [Brassicogethes aeneus]
MNSEEEENWALLCKDGKKQSPIALSKDIANEVFYTPFIWENYDINPFAKIKNNGHSAEVRLHISSQERPEVKGGSLPNIYVLDHLHFHWKSEHTLDDYRFPLELHLVHHAKQFDSLASAVTTPQGVAVFSVMFDYSPDDAEYFKPLVSVINTVTKHLESQNMSDFSLRKFLPVDTAGYYRYDGSLTTPNCNEGIVWTVFTNTIPISQSQALVFEELYTKNQKRLKHNYRSLQNINDRSISIKVSPLRAGSQSTTSSILITLSFGMISCMMSKIIY